MSVYVAIVAAAIAAPPADCSMAAAQGGSSSHRGYKRAQFTFWVSMYE